MEGVINFLSFNGVEEYLKKSEHIIKYKTMQEGVRNVKELIESGENSYKINKGDVNSQQQTKD